MYLDFLQTTPPIASKVKERVVTNKKADTSRHGVGNGSFYDSQQFMKKKLIICNFIFYVKNFFDLDFTQTAKKRNVNKHFKSVGFYGVSTGQIHNTTLAL